MKNLNQNLMLNITVDPFVAKLIEGNPDLKAAYEKWLLQEINLKELSAKTNYSHLKMMQTKGKDDKKKSVLKPEIF